MSVAVEINNAFDAVSSYFEEQSNSVLNNTTPPELTNILNVRYDGALSYSYENMDSSAAFSIGASQEATYSAAAILRELDMAFSSKFDIYTTYIQEQLDESAYYKSSGTYYSGVVAGNPTGGSRS